MLIGSNTRSLFPSLAQAQTINVCLNNALNEVIPVEMPRVISDVWTIL